jgi:pyridoxal phosphate enzyme (YggS family)
MAISKPNYTKISKYLSPLKVSLVAVSKSKPASDITDLYKVGQRDFGENYVQELVEKQLLLKDYEDINWHFVGHLQTNKVKLIAPFIHLIQSVDSLKLLQEIDKQAQKCDRVINCLLQIYIAKEETKFGMDENQLTDIINEINFGNLPNVNIIGLMGMSTLDCSETQMRSEFKHLKKLLKKYPQLKTLSIGMSGDYKIAIEEGSTMVRVGSLLFGKREKENVEVVPAI